MQEYQNLVKSGESADLGTAIQNLINDNLRFINTAFLAKIVKINQNTVDIQPILKQNASDKELIINNCLIAFNHSQLWDIQHKLKVGDIGIALVMQNDISVYKQNGQGGTVATRRFKDFNDAIYIPLSLYQTRPNADINYIIESHTKKCKLEFNNSEIGIFKAKLLTLESENTTLKRALKELADLLEAMASGSTSADGHGHTTITAPSSIGAFSSWYSGTINSLFKD